MSNVRRSARTVFAQITKLNPAADWYEALDDLVIMSYDEVGERYLFLLSNSGGGNLGSMRRFNVPHGCEVDGMHTFRGSSFSVPFGVRGLLTM